MFRHFVCLLFPTTDGFLFFGYGLPLACLSHATYWHVDPIYKATCSSKEKPQGGMDVRNQRSLNLKAAMPFLFHTTS